ncbi:helix-turn-helix domain-containing protein [uncultured Kordia sp.]|uniref:helix-turn-helix domain-containing protein n=1 Tax=uncultured Kordia sp. TaxID=507699 RepID=UPI002632FA11|nr:helix-turn-helix domain-containing protein [uncultured Kordia sp.]
MKFTFFTVLLILGILQGSIFVILLFRIKDRNKEANKFLSVFICMLVCTMLGRVVIDTNLIKKLPNFLALPDAIIYLYGPILYFYFKKLLSTYSFNKKEFLIHLIPACIFLLSEIPLLLEESNPLRILWSQHIRLRFIIIEGAAVFLNIFYLLLNIIQLRRYKKSTHNNFSFKQSPTYLSVILILIGVCLTAWLFSYISWVSGYYNPLSMYGYIVIWFTMVFLTYVLAFFAMIQPKLFKMPVVTKKEKQLLLSSSESTLLKEKLTALMLAEKPYLKPRLTLQELAEMMNVRINIVSYVINEEFKKNFNDFVNEYRIQEFMSLVRKGESKKMTILALAYEAGFNSKTTFNTKFKKYMGKTPFQFVKEQEKE